MHVIDPQRSQVRQFLIYSNFHIPFIAFALIGSSSIYLAIEISYPLVVLGSAGAFLIYQIDRVWLWSPEDLINQPLRVGWYHQHSSFKYISTLVALITGGTAIFFLHPITIGTGLLLGLIGLVYLLPLRDGKKRLKGRWLAKPAFIAFCWTFGGVIIPVIEVEGRLDAMVWSFFMYRYLLITANVLLADLPDRVGDEQAELVTLAVFLSEKRLTQIVYGLSGVAFLVGLIHGLLYQWPLLLFIDLVGAILLMMLVYVSSRKSLFDSHFFLSYVNDLVIGWPIVSLIIYYVLDVYI